MPALALRRASAAALLLAAACATLPEVTAPGAPEAPPAPLPQVRPVSPALRVTIPGGVSPAQYRAVRRTPGVARAARMALGRVAAETGAGGPQELTLAAVNPLEFRPLAPAITAQAEFVWRGLLDGGVVLAGEDRERIGAPLGSPIVLRGPQGRAAPVVAGTAPNGEPNLAGGLLSFGEAVRLGIGRPTVVVAAVRRGADPRRVARRIEVRVPGARVERMDPLEGHTFVGGTAASLLFGAFTYRSNPDGTIDPDPRWVRENIVMRSVPVLGRTRCHRLIFPQLRAALAEIDRAGLASTVDAADYHRVGGCYVARKMQWDPDKPVSMHAWGLALDINVGRNPFGRASRQDPRMVAIMERWGFRWGGRWSPPDPHHFELGALLAR